MRILLIEPPINKRGMRRAIIRMAKHPADLTCVLSIPQKGACTLKFSEHEKKTAAF